MTSHPLPERHGERGSIIFYILIAVVVFAALTYAVATSLRGNGTSLNSQQTSLAASDIIATGNRLVEAVTRLRLRDIPKDFISFENSTVTGYTNGACASGTCKVFDGAGGGLTWETAPSGSQTTAHAWGFTATRAINQVGTSDPELIALLPNLTLDVCNAINDLLSANPGSKTPPLMASINATTKFTGNYPMIYSTLTHATVNTKKAMCIQFPSAAGPLFTGTPLTNVYIYYQVLLVR